MPGASSVQLSGLAIFQRGLKSHSVDYAIEQFISLLKRRQISNSRPCALATTQLLLRVVADFKGRNVAELLARVRAVGVRLMAAQPRELVVGNIVRRVLGLIREVAQEKADPDSSIAELSDALQNHSILESKNRPYLRSSISTFSPLRHGATEPSDIHADLSASQSSFTTPTAPAVTSLFGIFSDLDYSPTITPPGHRSPVLSSKSPQHGFAESLPSFKEMKSDILEGVREILDELDQASEQISSYALNHIHANEIILTHGVSPTIQKFLLAAARKRKFTVVHVEGDPNDVEASHNVMLTGSSTTTIPTAKGTGDGDDADVQDQRVNPLTAAGVTTILVPDSAVFGIMARVNKVLLAPHTVLANGALVATSGAHTIAAAAQAHKVPVLVLSPVYKLSPIYPFQPEELLEVGGPGAVVAALGGRSCDWDDIDVENALWDYVPAEMADLYITNLGGHAPSYLYRIVADHYDVEDINL